MAAQWLRLWHEMPNDPKWRTIARHSKQPVSLVTSTFLHMMVNASQSSTRGTLKNWSNEDVASALDVEEGDIQAIYDAMQGRVIEGDALIGWSKTQFFCDTNSTGRPALSEWRVIRARIFSRDDYTCRYCGARGVKLECDHVIPVSRGGSSDDSNLVTACRPCNRSKRNHLLQEWRNN